MKRPRKWPKVCGFCGINFIACHKNGKFCGYKCSSAGTPKPQNSPKFAYSLKVFREADRNTPYGKSRLQYVAKKLGCTPAAASYAAKRMGYVWKTRPRCKKFFTTTHVERRYVYSIGCIICGEKRAVDAAHLIASRHGGSGMIPNIIPLCPSHHRIYDKGLLTHDETEKIVEFLFEKYPELKLKLTVKIRQRP